MGRRTARDTASLIDEVARGERLLEDIKDPQLRETVRLALRLHKDPYSGPDARTRSRIRTRVLRSLRPHGVTFADRVAVAFDILARPTPYAMRALALALALVSVAASTAVVSAGSVAADPLYTVKIASEQARLALATTPEDRAIVQLSIAEHRLAEAAAHAALGNDGDASVASSEYGEHLANAAAELAQVEALAPESAILVTQLQQKIDVHRATAAAVVARLSENPETASAAAVLALLAARATPAGDLSPAAAIAAQAAQAADEVATAAERRVVPPVPAGSSRSTEPPRRTPAPGGAAGTPSSQAAGSRGQSGRDTASRNERAAEVSRRAAEKAKAAAKKAKEGSKRTPTPAPRRDRSDNDDND